MNVISHNELSGIIADCEPRLEAAMRHCPTSFMPDGFRLSGSICGFASNVLAQYLRETQGLTLEKRIGSPADDLTAMPDNMWRHVILNTPDGSTIDPTYGQFMRLIGINEALAKNETEAYALYPARRVAYIPAGQERYFGERFAEFMVAQRERLITIRQKQLRVGETVCEIDRLKSGLDAQGLYDVVADIWSPNRYRRFDHDGDGQVFVDKAVDAMKISDTE